MCVSIRTYSLPGTPKLYKKAVCPFRVEYATTRPLFLYKTNYVASFNLYPQCLDIFWTFKLEKYQNAILLLENI